MTAGDTIITERRGGRSKPGGGAAASGMSDLEAMRLAARDHAQREAEAAEKASEMAEAEKAAEMALQLERRGAEVLAAAEMGIFAEATDVSPVTVTPSDAGKSRSSNSVRERASLRAEPSLSSDASSEPAADAPARQLQLAVPGPVVETDSPAQAAAARAESARQQDDPMRLPTHAEATSQLDLPLRA